jgi:hypothetical protein
LSFVDVAIGTLDDPTVAAPVIQLALEERLPWVEHLSHLPGETPEEHNKLSASYASTISFQHPDYDTVKWPSD